MSASRSPSLKEITSQVRENIRVLFISTDISLLQPNQQTLDGYIQLGEVFDEVHILVLRTGATSPFPALRVSKNTWLYTVSTDTWWWAPIPGRRVARDQLEFNDDFRPDLIVARDPFTSGVLAHWLGRVYKRAVQVHVTEDFTDSDFGKRRQAWLYRAMARWVLRRSLSVRTTADDLVAVVSKHLPTGATVEVLPRFNNYRQLAEQPATIDIRQKYPQYRFIYVFVGALSYDGSFPPVLEAMRGILQNHTVGLLVYGEGKARERFQKRCRDIGLERQVVFSRDADDLVSYLKAANVVIVTDTSAEADEVVMQAAAIGVSIVATETVRRTQLFADRQSILFLPVDNVSSWQFTLSAILNDLSLRRTLQYGVEAVVTNQLMQDPHDYQAAYKQSIERAILTLASEDDKL